MHFCFRQEICIPASSWRLSITRQVCYYGKRFDRKRNVNERNSQNVRRKQEGRKTFFFLGSEPLKGGGDDEIFNNYLLGEQPYCRNCRRYKAKMGSVSWSQGPYIPSGNADVITTDRWSPECNTHVMDWEINYLGNGCYRNPDKGATMGNVCSRKASLGKGCVDFVF